jgi:hypothetical protein
VASKGKSLGGGECLCDHARTGFGGEDVAGLRNGFACRLQAQLSYFSVRRDETPSETL